MKLLQTGFSAASGLSTVRGTGGNITYENIQVLIISNLTS